MPATNAPHPQRPHPGSAPPRGTGWRTLILSAAYFFLILTAYYMLRPIRETMAIEKGADKLPWLMTATLVAMLVANPLYALLVSRMPRRRFVPAAQPGWQPPTGTPEWPPLLDDDPILADFLAACGNAAAH